MSSRTPTYVPSPNWDIPADSDVVVLGRLIKDPKNPQSKIPKSKDKPHQPSKIYEGEKIDWQTTLDRLRSGSVGLWAKCLQVVGGQLSLSQLKSSIEDHRFTTLETKYFLPDDEYLAGALQDPGVQAYLLVNNWRKPVYLITGIKIARGASVNTEDTTERSAKIEVKANTSSAGVPLAAGPQATYESRKKRGVTYAGSSDYIFAYQLTRMKPKTKGQDCKAQGYVKGAVFGKDEERHSAEINIRDVFEVEEETCLGLLDIWEQVERDVA